MQTILLNARQLRKNLTPAEIKLWQRLRRKQLAGLRFRRQVTIGKYIVDFICYEARLIIEIDGGQHNEDAIAQYDRYRDKWLEAQGYKVIRFWNNEVLGQIENVL
ncbi:MAG TPA: endonuclease domain-containing protein, partial [Aquella sp.]|nr:endonuclease domain-containing protein [Aquella sp.]